jgi:hypothetical protein
VLRPLNSGVRYHLFAPRHITALPAGTDSDGVKLYAISVSSAPVVLSEFLPQLRIMKQGGATPWSTIPAFAIVHVGSSNHYLALCHWGNDNELFVRVAVKESGGWVEQPSKYSFCLWDMEVMWRERTSYIKWMYSGSVDLEAYRADLGDT